VNGAFKTLILFLIIDLEILFYNKDVYSLIKKRKYIYILIKNYVQPDVKD